MTENTTINNHYLNSLIKKDIPMFPDNMSDDEYCGDCPRCGNGVDVFFKFCPECGQRLDWATGWIGKSK